MFFEFSDSLQEIDRKNLRRDTITCGYLSAAELKEVKMDFGFAESTVLSCTTTNPYFRSGVEVYQDYTFTKLRITGRTPLEDDWLALYIRENQMLVINVKDDDNSTKGKFLEAVHRYTPDHITLEKLICAFLDALLSQDVKIIEGLSCQLTDLEDHLIQGDVSEDFNGALLSVKKELQRLHYYYEQILDITQALEENENEVLSTGPLLYITNLTRRVDRLREDADRLRSDIDHLQDAYFSYMDTKLNSTMKVLTVITTIFFPLTIIVGWYGMNFTTMPELTWRFGYLYVILLSVFVVLLLAIIGKVRKWFH